MMNNMMLAQLMKDLQVGLCNVEWGLDWGLELELWTELSKDVDAYLFRWRVEEEEIRGISSLNPPRAKSNSAASKELI